MSLSSRTLYLLVAALCFGALTAALISQHMFGMRPCAWCVFQRLLLVVMGGFSLVAAWLSRTNVSQFGSRLLGVFGVATAVGGIVAAWYQFTVASNSFSCDLSFADNVMTSSGLESGLPFLFGIYATCMDARVELLGIEYALWGMATFIVAIVLLLWAILQRKTH